jgi:(4-(4-[2-(gamma-L-glutamylamino)ethyl]phenoxymethyl)furan-2-yl)methanamine synthase
MHAPDIIGWDIGGAHVKAARLSNAQAASARLLDVVQWPCPLWLGLAQLQQVLQQAQQRWPDLAACRHAVTMTGEMVDCFEHRQDGVQRIAAMLADTLPAPQFYGHDSGWCTAEGAGEQWQHIASANWLATASHCALAMPDGAGVLVDIGSTTTDLIAFANGRVLTAQRSDVQRLASGELVYHGVVRTPLCALARQVRWRGVLHNVMNEFFATTADVYRLTDELAPEHDQHPSADGAAKDGVHTQARLARMIGLDARDGSAAEWLAFAQAWRAAQLGELRGQLQRVLVAHGLSAATPLVGAGCGAFLLPDLLRNEGLRYDYGRDIAAPAEPQLAAWASVAAPAVAVAVLLQKLTTQMMPTTTTATEPAGPR